jgi:hypothetical protein
VGSTTKQKEKLKAKKKRCDTYATHHARDDRWTSSKLSHLVEPVTSSPVMKEQEQVKTTKNTILVKFL